MEFIDYDKLYNEAIIDFSNQLGLGNKTPQLSEDSPLNELAQLVEQTTQDEEITEQESPDNQVASNQTVKTSNSTPNYSKFKGFEQFNRLYDKVQAYNPDAAKYRQILTKIASLESSFRPSIVNGIGAAGYFQFIDSTRTNIMKKLGKPQSKQYFLNNPEIQIVAAIQLAKEFERQFSSSDIQLAYKKGHTINGLISGAWLGGAGSVKRYLKSGKDSTDGGTTVATRIKIGDQV